MKICDSEGRDCIEEMSTQTFNCSMTCTGMHADTNWKDEHLTDEKDKDKYSMLSSEYQNFKKEHVKHFRFSFEASSSMYGKQIIVFVLLLVRSCLLITLISLMSWATL